MEIKTFNNYGKIFFLFIFLICKSFAFYNEAYFNESSLENLGTIILQKRSSARLAFTPSCFYEDTFLIGISFSAIDYYYDINDNNFLNIYKISLGSFSYFKGFSVKLAYSNMNAMNIYYENNLFFSFGIQKIPFVKPSFEIKGYNIGLASLESYLSKKDLNVGASLLFPFKKILISFCCSDIPVFYTGEAKSFFVTLKAGINTNENILGNQGFFVIAQKEQVWNFSVGLGEQYWLFKNLAVNASFVTNPVIISVGITASWPDKDFITTFVNHPILGWSRGIGINWAIK